MSQIFSNCYAMSRIEKADKEKCFLYLAGTRFILIASELHPTYRLNFAEGHHHKVM